MVREARLVGCIKEPNLDPTKDKEPVEAAIWEAMDGLARFSQDSIIDRIGMFAIGSNPDREAPDAVPAVAAVHGREVDCRARAAMEADIDVFRTNTERARLEESQVSIYTAAAGGVGGVDRTGRARCRGERQKRRQTRRWRTLWMRE